MIHFFTNLPTEMQLLLALMLPFVLSLLIGPRMIAVLRAMKAGQPIREARKGVLAPEHQSKVGTPTMGGVMIIGLILLFALLFMDLRSVRVQCCLIVIVVTAFLGFLDDFAKIRRHSSDGVSGWFKIGLQFLAAAACSVYLYLAEPQVCEVLIPFYGELNIGWLFIPLGILTIIATSNAVNLTDGLDGLASGLMVPVCVVTLIGITSQIADCCCHSTADWSDAPLTLAMLSACVGFLWFNAHPAKVFMGDTGSLALGGALGALAVCHGLEFMLIIMGGVFVAEATSVVIQVFWFKLTRRLYGEGRRFFRMAPLHHHFEKLGWSETQVCIRFWIIGAILAFLTITVAAASHYH